MVIKLAWRNIWRNKVRSGTVITSIVLGIAVLIFAIGFIQGTIDAYIKGAIENEVSHLQIHPASYDGAANPTEPLPEPQRIQNTLEETAAVVHYSFRRLGMGMIHQSGNSQGVQIRGIAPEQEAATTRLHEKVVKGSYWKNQQNGLLISERLGEQLGLDPGMKATLHLQRPDGTLKIAQVTVVGWYNTGNALLDRQRVFLPHVQAGSLLGQPTVVHEVAVVLRDLQDLEVTEAQLNQYLPTGTLVQNYRALSPSVELYETQIAASSAVLIVIIMLALIFGIINTMLMAILERSKELGMLLAVGMKRREVFWMVVVETLLLGLLALPVGLLFGVGTVGYFSVYGFDMSSYQGAMDSVGMAAVVYPPLQWSAILNVTFAVFFTALLAALYPAYKATRLQPIEAMRRL